MTPKTRNVILRAQRETRCAEDRQTPEDIATEKQYEDVKSLKRFCGFHLAIPTEHEINPAVEWNGTAAVAEFTIDGNAFVIRREPSEFVLLSGSESSRELSRVEVKSEFRGGAKFLSAIGDFLGVSGTEISEP